MRLTYLQENYEFLSRCINEHLGFKGGKPLAACVIYKCLLHWHAFESERTAIFDYVIEGINEMLKVIHNNALLNLSGCPYLSLFCKKAGLSLSLFCQVGDENVTLPYWLSNASALLCLLQRNLRSNGFFNASSERTLLASGLSERVVHVSKNVLFNFFYLV